MKLKELLKGLEIKKIIGNTEIEIKEIKIDTKCVQKGDLFVCIKGNSVDSHKLIKDIKDYGAFAVVAEEKLDTNLPQIIVEDSRKALSIICSNYYKNPEKDLKIIGITGTNGKTTISYMVKEIIEKAGKKCGVIGTLGAFWGEKEIKTGLTTPDPIDLFKIFSKMRKDEVEYVVMEVSAHAIELSKIFGINFFVACFSNLTQDHLDYFKTFDNYKKVKRSFLLNKNNKFVVVNSDDDLGIEVINKNEDALSYGINNPCDVFAINIKEKSRSIDFTINLFDEIREVKLNLIGSYNVYNALASATITALIGISIEKIIEGLNAFNGVKGRMQVVGDKKGALIYVDYAHTPDGLEKSILSLKKVCKGKVICLFGCGGNRDQGKREIMGEISSKYADFTIITSDNPRYEEPMQIIFAIEKGVLKNSKDYVIIQNRKQAIDYAIKMLKENDALLIAGKGAEEYQEVYGIKRIFNDKDTVIEILKEN
ncbi:MAG: UDP-N-acetylmuramoyl-L-alanyl-D-glutamate--2,6-diaminopimelate ligase [Clostridiales bacterium]|nr:UDP-N-acetylmuramoyl-L-alanyl-D-glutamate--2,6-diaminopimelate ligase [Clostridiales bacterium]